MVLNVSLKGRLKISVEPFTVEFKNLFRNLETDPKEQFHLSVI